MGFFDKISRIFSSPGRDEVNSYWVAARCTRCGEVIRARINLSNDLSQEYEGERANYFCRKVLMGEGRCFQQIEVWLKFDANRKLIDHTISGGEFVE